jgi:hypothetical protein
MRLLKTAETSVVNLHLTETRHPQTMELWHEVRIHVADLNDQLR